MIPNFTFSFVMFHIFFKIKINFVPELPFEHAAKIKFPIFQFLFLFFFLSDLKRIQNNTWIHVIDCCDNLN